MMRDSLSAMARSMAILPLLALPGVAAAAAVTYQVSVDTSSLVGTAGNINFQFNPGGNVHPSTAQISGFTTDGSFAGAPSLIGDVTGTLPATVTLGNSTAFNDYFHPFTFGNSFSFLLDINTQLTNPAASSGSTFGIALFAADGSTPLLTSDPFGFAAVVEVLLDGSTVPSPIAATPGGPSAVTFTDSAPVPEPATNALVAGTLLALGCAARRRNR